MSSSASATVRVEKATSDLLIGPDWTLNMEICDSINTDHGQAKDVVKAVKKRLQHKNPRVQFLALTLLETVIKNCGDYVHFHVVERDILQEMVKIVRKKTDMQVRDKILVLLDSWQEAFGGPGGKHPQYYGAYIDLKRSGVEFPQRSVDAAPIFTPPVTHPAPRHPPAGYGMPSNSSIRLEEAMASEMANLSISDLDSIRSVMELLSDMLQAVNPNDRAAVKDEVIMDLVSQCLSNQKKLMSFINSTGDEKLLGQGLALNDYLQSLLAKHDAIASGSTLPMGPSPCITTPNASTDPIALASEQPEYEEEEDDEFSQLARRNSKIKSVPSQSSSTNTTTQEASPNSSDMITGTAATSTAESSTSASSHALALPDPPTPVRTGSRGQDMIDLLSITLSSNPSPPHTPLTPPSASSANGFQAPVSPHVPVHHPYSSQPYPANQGYTSYDSYVVPWAQQSQPQPQAQSQQPPWAQQAQPQSQFQSHPQPRPPWTQQAYPQPQVQSHSQPQPPWGQQAQAPAQAPWEQQGQPQLQEQHQPHTQPQFPQYSSSYPPPPWAATPNSYSNNIPGNSYQFPASHANTLNTSSTIGGTGGYASSKQAGSTTSQKPFVPSYRLFEDLIDRRHTDGGIKTSGTSPSLSGSSSQSMVGGRK